MRDFMAPRESPHHCWCKDCGKKWDWTEVRRPSLDRLDLGCSELWTRFLKCSEHDNYAKIFGVEIKKEPE